MNGRIISGLRFSQMPIALINAQPFSRRGSPRREISQTLDARLLRWISMRLLAAASGQNQRSLQLRVKIGRTANQWRQTQSFAWSQRENIAKIYQRLYGSLRLTYGPEAFHVLSGSVQIMLYFPQHHLAPLLVAGLLPSSSARSPSTISFSFLSKLSRMLSSIRRTDFFSGSPSWGNGAFAQNTRITCRSIDKYGKIWYIINIRLTPTSPVLVC